MCSRCEWDHWLSVIDDMLLETDDYEFATDTLEGIRKWVSENEHITDNQKQAIINIQEVVNE